VLITDYKMPVVNGLQLLEAAPQSAKKILISGYVSEIAQDRIEKLNASFFEKPVPMREIGRLLQEHRNGNGGRSRPDRREMAS
jgi:YesN/AraC family two-component response regulator